MTVISGPPAAAIAEDVVEVRDVAERRGTVEGGAE